MNRATFNKIINHCRSTKCYHCDYKEECGKLNKVNVEVANLIYYKDLTEEQKQLLKEIK